MFRNAGYFYIAVFGLTITVAYGLWFAIAQGDAGQSFMRWFAALPIT